MDTSIKRGGSGVLTLTRTDYNLTLNAEPEAVKDALTHTFKEMVMTPGHKCGRSGKFVPGRSYTSYVKKELFSSHLGELVTYPGFYEKVLNVLRNIGFTVVVRDLRNPFPVPDYKNAMTGLRDYQRAALLEALNADDSGQISLPTRWGKSYTIAAICRAFPSLKTVIAAPGVSLLNQLVEQDLTPLLPGREIGRIYTGARGLKKESADITICSLDSLGKVCKDSTQLLIVDEAHAAVSGSRVVELSAFTNARRIALGASLSGRSDNADILIEGIFGKTIVKRTYTQGVQLGACCPIRVYIIKYPFKDFTVKSRNAAYDRLVFKSEPFMRSVTRLLKKYIPEDWQSLIFISTEKQALQFRQVYGEDMHIAMQKQYAKVKGLQQMIESGMRDNTIKRCCSSAIFSAGLTFPDLRVMVNMAGGAGSISSTQRPGRVSQVRPGKKRGYVVDFQPYCADKVSDTDKKKRGWWHVVRDAGNRIKSYVENGYEVVEVPHTEMDKLLIFD